MELLKKRILVYGIALIIGLVYVWILYLSIFDVHANDYYINYYITEESRYYLADGELEQYTSNNIFSYTTGSDNYRNLGIGWNNDIENYGVWSLSGDNTLLFYDEEVDYSKNYTLYLNTSSSLDYSREIYINGSYIGDFVLDSNGAMYLSFDADCLADGCNTIEIITEDEVVPAYEKLEGATDTRTLNFMLEEAEIIEE